MKKLLATLLFFVASMAYADTIKIIVPFAPGGAADQAARATERILTNHTAHTYVVEYKAGAGGSIAANYVAKNKSTETVLLVHSTAVVINSLAPDATYSLNDFVPVSSLGSVPMALVTNPNSKIANIKALLKTTDPVFYGSSGVGTATHISGEIFAAETGLNMIHVPYKGEAAAFADILGNNLTVMFTSISVAHNQNVNALAVTNTKRNPAFPNAPTLREVGIKGFDVSPYWLVLLANTTADPKIVAEVNAAMVAGLKNPEEMEYFTKAGIDINSKAPYNTQQFLVAEQQRMRKVLDKVK
jgi:tripartite-type tricarboxylate transporter receptor subunit TctC